jgi:hypothetical protein
MDPSALMQLAVAMYGEQEAKNMSASQLRMFEQQLNDVRDVKLPDLPQIQADQLGESAVAGMKSDQGLRGKQLQALATIQNLIDSGGLDLTDKASLEEAMSHATNQQHRARAGVAADAAARGQLNSGNRLVMDMDAAQSGANAARETGMQTAAMAQRRRLEAIREASGLAGGLREQDWREAESANHAHDARDERNAAAREKAQYYNAGLPQQNFTNALGKATGQLPSANAYGGALGAGATDARTSAGGMAGIIGAGANAYGGVTKNGGTGSGTQTYSYNPDESGDRGGAADLLRGEDDK